MVLTGAPREPFPNGEVIWALGGGVMENVLVLVVEDEPLIQLDIETAVQDGGYMTATAGTRPQS
jgi:hypothetical protein